MNRGEAAVRCIRGVASLRALEDSDICSIVLYTDVDRDAPFVRYADEAVEIPSPGDPVAAYLDHEAVLAALREVGADAVWPGWGFLAESPEFVDAVEASGMRFLGPSGAAMRKVGDKISAKRLAEGAGVAVTAWSGGALESEVEAAHHASRIGYPVALKASAGGGGRGIRIVTDPRLLAEAYRSASSEARSAFGDGRLFLEKCIARGRHVEVQIATDQHGNGLALGCRDCSVQRRHQKLLEETPAPNLSPELRAALEDAALRTVAAAGYVGVGTVEFLVSDDAYTFLEVNPRLQVEHGITEEITGVDLVQLQIRIARGESLAGREIHERGFAIEARVCAEDPDAGFLPSPGRIGRCNPAMGPRVRIDSGVVTGTIVPPHFDSLVAKVIATGETREDARSRLACALRDFELVVEGGATNKGYLLELLDARDFRDGGVDTGFVERWNERRDDELDKDDKLEDRDALVAAAILAYQRARAAARLNFYADLSTISAEHVPPSQGQQIDLSSDGESYRLEVYAIGAWRYRVHLDGLAVGATMREEGAHAARLVIDGRLRRILYDATEMGLRLEVDGRARRFGWQTAGQVSAGTPAMVVAIHVSPGDRVEVGQPLGLVEAMKMEIGVQAPVAGVVTEVLVRKGQRVGAGEVLLVIDPAPEESGVVPSGRRLALPEQRDPLALLFRAGADSPLAEPDLAVEAEPTARKAAIDTLREEIRRVLLGYDANLARGESLVAFLEAPLPDQLSQDFRRELAEIRHELTTFADVEQLFIRAPRASVSGELGPSNNARFRMYVRRLRAAGAGIAEEFLELVQAALSHYGVSRLAPTDALERAVLRMLSSQLSPDLRCKLVLGMIRRTTRLAESGVDLGSDARLRDALDRIAGMRGLLPDALADAAIEASYVIFEGPAIEARAEQSSANVESWVAAAETDFRYPPTDVLLELAASPRRVFERVERWLGAADPGRRAIALAALVQRLYAPRVARVRSTHRARDLSLHRVDYAEGVLLAASAGEKEVAFVAESLCRAGAEIRDSEGVELLALELVVPGPRSVSDEQLLESLVGAIETVPPSCRLTLCLLSDNGEPDYRTFERTTGDARSGEVELREDFHGLHPETAERVDLQRWAAFELERLPGPEGIYGFYCRSREVPGDERVCVLGDVQDRSPLAGREAESHLAEFERIFHHATRTLRSILQVRDPRRRLQWNRVAIFVSPEIFLGPETAGELSRRLAPETRHLGLEKVLVRLSLLDRDAPEAPAKPLEIVIIDQSAGEMQISWRTPHRDPLEPARDYERKVVEARRRRLVYPYEIIRMLTSGEQNRIDGNGADPGEATALPGGTFEEYDIAPAGDGHRRVSVAGRPFGRNVAGVVFGVISTPTSKTPEGMRRVLLLSDPTMDLGALAAPECDRIVAALDLAEDLAVPCEWVPVSSGARIAMDSGTENLDATARVVRRIVDFTQKGNTIHLIVQGVNIGAQSYFDALATMLMHTRGILIMTPRASMVLTGRAALEASGAVSAEDEVAIGGFERVMGPNGQAQFYARNLSDAYRILYEYYRYSHVSVGEAGPRRFSTRDPAERSVCDFPVASESRSGFSTVGEIFDGALNPDRKRPFPMRSVMAALIDQDGGHLERWRSMVAAETAIVWDAHLGGVAVTLIGIESENVTREGYRPLDGPESWSGGTLFPLSSKKVARAINSASGNRPVVILANLSGFDGSPESLRKLQLEYGAEIARAVVNFQGPIFFHVVSRYHGGAYVVFSQELNDGLAASALTGSYASVIGGGPAAAVVFAREVRAQAVSDPRVTERERALRYRPTVEARQALDSVVEEVMLEKQAELAEQFDEIHSVERAREVGSLGQIIEPARMRPHLIAQLEMALRAGRG